MIFKAKEKVHVIQKRAFETDVRRHFIGEVTEAGDSAIRVQGYAFIFDTSTNQYIRRPELRERVISLVDGALITNILPPNANIGKACYAMSKDDHLCVTDGETFSLDINEFGARR
jgi:predicted RNA-binding protein with TRAM domain